MKKILSFWLAIMILLTGVVPSWDFLDNQIYEAKAAANLYVATTGADSGDCQTELSPCLTINYAIGQASNGDTIYVAAGTYDELVSANGKSVNLIGADRDTTIIAPSATGTAVYLKPAADNDMSFKNFKVVPSSNSYTGIQMYEQQSGSWVTMNVDNVWIDQALIGVLISSGSWNTLYSVTNSLITRPKRQGVVNVEMGGGNRTIDTVDNVFIWSDGTQDSGYYCIDQVNTVVNSMCTGTYAGIRFSIDGNYGEEDPYFANNYMINTTYTSFDIGNFSNDNKKCGAVINNTSIGNNNHSAAMDCYSGATGDQVGLMYNNFFMDGKYGVNCEGPVNYGNNAFVWTWWESGSDQDGYEGSCNTDGDIDTSNTYHNQNDNSTSAWPSWEFEKDGGGEDDMTWTIASHTAYTVTVTPDPGWTNDEWVGRWMSHQDTWSYMPYYIIDNDSDTLTVAADDIQSFTNINLNQDLQMDNGDWIKIFADGFPYVGMSSNLIDTGMDPVDILTATEYTYVQDSYNGQARPYDAKGLGEAYTQWDRGASERYYLKSVFDQPTVSSPTATGYNVTSVSMATSTAAGEDYATHDSSDWRVCSDLACSSVVWSTSNDTTNLTSYEMTGTGALSGLSSYTQYYASVRYDNSAGSSSWSDPYSFWTSLDSSSDSVTWDFDEATPASYYTYTDTVVQIGSGNSYAELIDLGGGTYTPVGFEGNYKKKAITITNSGSELTDYQVGLTVTYDSDMQEDFDDLRFTISDGNTEIDYWVEDYTASTSATVWVEVPTIVASGDTTIYMFYGNDSLSSESNIDNTFLFGDDFDDGTVDTSKWTTNGTFTESDGSLLLSNGDGVWSTNYALEDDTLVFYRAYIGATGYKANLGFVESSHRFEDDLDHGERGFDFGFWTGTNCYLERAGWNGFEEHAVPYGTGWNDYSVEYHEDTSLKFTYPSTTFTETTSNSIVRVSNDPHLQISSYDMADFRADYVYVRKAAGTEPSTSFGSEEVAGDLSSVAVTLSSGQGYEELFSVSHVLGGTSEGSVNYQISRDGSGWYYHTGTGWSAVVSNETDKNTITELNTYLPALVTEVGTGSFYFKAFLESNGTQKTEIDNITLAYDGGAPTGLADFAFDSSTATTATFTWTPAVDGAFDHYEIWYGTDQSDVQGRIGTAVEWDGDDDGDLSTVSTGTGTITGLSAGVDYYAKIWAVDGLGYESTLDDISFNTNQTPTAASVTATPATDGSGEVTIGFVGDDGDDDTLSAKVEYNVGTGWAAATLKSTVTATYDTPVVNNDNAYQIGTVTTMSGANTIGVTWDSSEDVEDADTSSAQIRVTTYDTIADSTAAISSTFAFDQASPSGGLTSITASAVLSTSFGVGWNAVTSETNFTNYQVYYKKSTDSSYSLAGTLTDMTTSSISLTGLTSNTTYNVYVQANDDYGNYTTSPVVSQLTSADDPGWQETAGGGGVSVTATSTTEDSDSEETDVDSGELAGEEEVGAEDFDEEIQEEEEVDSDVASGESEENGFVDIPIIVPEEEVVVETPVVVVPVAESEEEEEVTVPTTSVFVSTDVTEEVYEEEIVVTFHDSDDDELRSIVVPIIADDVSFKGDFTWALPITLPVDLEDKPSSYIEEEIDYEEAVEEIVDDVEDLVDEIDMDFETDPAEIIEDVFADEDEDGIFDIWEEENFGDTDTDGTADTDGDGLTDGEEAATGSDPLDADSDNDGISDLAEVYLGTDPESWDSDGDGISDTDELIAETDPNEKDVKEVDENIYDEDTDTDGDGMSDYMEAYYGTDPNDADSDDDGISDTEELDYDLDPNTADYIEEIDTQVTNIVDDVVSSDSEVTVKGTSSPNTTVVVYVFGGGAVQDIAETTTDDAGKFVTVLSSKLMSGNYQMFIASVDEEEEEVEELSAVTKFEVDTSVEAPQVEIKEFAGTTSFGLGSKVMTDNPRPKMRAISTPGAIIHISWKSLIFTSVVVADSQTGEFEVQPPEDLEEDDHIAYIYAEDPETGVTGKTTQVNFSVTTDAFHESAAQREAADRFPYGYLLLAALIAAGGAFIFLKRGKSVESKLIDKLK